MSEDAGAIRVGHREREAAVALLQEAAADGRLGLGELDERLDAALSARTVADLDRLVADLTRDRPWSPAPQTPPVPRPRAAGYAREDPLRLEAGVSRERRDGRWTLPP